jgi:hypothetical protein
MVQAVSLAITPTNQIQNPLPITITNQVVIMEVIVNHQIIVNPRIILVLVLNPLVVQEAQDLLLVEVDQVVNLEVDLGGTNAINQIHLNI